MASQKTPITKDELIRVNSAMLALTSLFVIARLAVNLTKRKPFELTDLFLYFGFVLYLVIWSCYMAVIPPLFKVYAAAGGEIPLYPTIKQDTALMLRLITAAQMSFYTSLFSVKLSFLTLYRKLLQGLPGLYKKVWWGIIAFCFLSWIGSVLSSMFTCNDIKAKYKEGKCAGTPDEQQRVIFSLYFAFAVDVATDLMIMILPFRLTWNLQMPRGQKIGVFVLFGSGFIVILFAILRVVQLGVENGKTRMPEPKWMLMWTILETSMAVIIGCSPAFVVFIRKTINSKKASYNAQGYIKHSTDEIKMKSLTSPSTRPRNNDTFWDDGHSSQEELAKNDGIIVTTNMRQDSEGSPSSRNRI